MAIDGSKSTFTESNNYQLDTFKEMFELSSTDIDNVKIYKDRKAYGGYTTDIFEGLDDLSSKIVTSDDWNLLLHAMYNLEQAYKEKGLMEIKDTIEDYVKEYAQTDINNRLGTMVNSLLLTNATQVLISNDEPNVIEGALWIKPKTT